MAINREGVFGECRDEGGAFDIGRLAERLLLFERVVLRSQRLEEIPVMVQAFGLDGLTRLLKSGALRLDPHGYTFGTRDPRPLTYEITAVMNVDREMFANRRAFAVVEALPKREGQKLATAIDHALVRIPDNFLHVALNRVQRDVTANFPTVHKSAVLAAHKIIGVPIEPSDLTLRFHVDDNGLYRAETNLVHLGVGEDVAHNILRGALLGLARVEQKLEQMKSFQTICDFREDEVGILTEKAQLAWDQQRADVAVGQLTRVLRLKKFPDLPAAARVGNLDFAKLLAVRESEECRQFRRWLQTLDSVTDEELEAQMAAVGPTFESDSAEENVEDNWEVGVSDVALVTLKQDDTVPGLESPQSAIDLFVVP